MKHVTRLCLLLACWMTVTSTQAADKPNILVIWGDDIGPHNISAYNHGIMGYQTPNIDRLAREGMTFTEAHCSDTVCTPSRYGLLTGRYAWRGRLKNKVLWSGYEPQLVENIMQQVSEQKQRQEAQGDNPVLLAAQEIRLWLSRLLRPGDNFRRLWPFVHGGLHRRAFL